MQTKNINLIYDTNYTTVIANGGFVVFQQPKTNKKS